MVKQAVKVLIRARPTASFASKNIKLDPLTGVRKNQRMHSYDCLDYCSYHR